MRNSRIAPLYPSRRRALPSPLLILVLLVVGLIAAIYFLSTLPSEVPTQPVEVDVTNAAGR